jgi:hypothetical protein
VLKDVWKRRNNGGAHIHVPSPLAMHEPGETKEGVDLEHLLLLFLSTLVVRVIITCKNKKPHNKASVSFHPLSLQVCFSFLLLVIDVVDG